ncbi:MAG: acyltransferase family protein [Chthoniobacteraceae bacterium]
MPKTTRLGGSPSRSPSGNVGAGGRIDFLDRIRGFAILLVVAYHALGAGYGLDQLHWRRFLRDFVDAPQGFVFFTPVTFGWLGVAVFFAVSGFCIHLSHQKARTPGFRNFFLRRFFRIYPPYFAALCFFALLFPLVTLRADCLASFRQFWAHLLLVNNGSSELFYGINPSFWSVVVEVQLYVLYPLLLWLVGRFGWRTALWGCGFLEIALRIVQSVHCLPDWVLGSPFYYWFSWSVGARLADDYLKGRPLFLARCPLWVWPAAVVGSNLFRPASTLTFVFGALAATKWISYELSRPTAPATGNLWARFLTRVGVVSYSLYLFNQPLLGALGSALETAGGPLHISPTLRFGIVLIVGGGLLILGSEIFYRWVEAPSSELGRRICARLAHSRTGSPRDPKNSAAAL